MKHKYLPGGLATVLLLQSCISPRMFLPEFDEEARSMQAYLKPSSHIAVVTMASSTSDSLPLFGLGDAVAEKLAAVTEQELNVKATALDQKPGSDWAVELERLIRDGGVVRNSGHEAFLRERGFDAYLLIIFQEQLAPNSGYVLGRGGVPNEELVRYEPMFRIYTSNNQPLMRTALTSVWACDTVNVFNRDGSYNREGGARLDNRQDCATKFESAYATKLQQRTALYE